MPLQQVVAAVLRGREKRRSLITEGLKDTLLSHSSRGSVPSRPSNRGRDTGLFR